MTDWPRIRRAAASRETATEGRSSRAASTGRNAAGSRASSSTVTASFSENGPTRVRHHREPVDLDGSRGKLDGFAVACEVVGPLALDLDGREPRRNLLDRTREAR